MNPAKGIRSCNFNKEELLLLDEVLKFRNVIECKTTNKLSLGEKENAWQKILASFNAKNLQARTIDQVKTKYDNLKAKTRKEVAKLKLSQTGTGGGPGVGDLDCVIEAVLNIINYKTVVGLHNEFDSDTQTANNFLNKDMVEDSQIMLKIVDKVPSGKNVHTIDIEESLEPASQNIENFVVEDYMENVPADRNTYAKNVIHSASTSGRVAEVLENSEPGICNWSKYTSVKLKRKVNEKLKTQAQEPLISAKEPYYKRKLDLIERSFEQECIDRQKKNARDDEEHAKKMLLVDLDIEIRKAELAKLGE